MNRDMVDKLKYDNLENETNTILWTRQATKILREQNEEIKMLNSIIDVHREWHKNEYDQIAVLENKVAGLENSCCCKCRCNSSRTSNRRSRR